MKDKIKPEHAEKINKSSQELRDAIASNNMDNIKTKTQELKNVLGEVSTGHIKLQDCCASATTGAARRDGRWCGRHGTGTSSEGFDSGAGSSGNSGAASPSDATQQQQEQPPRS